MKVNRHEPRRCSQGRFRGLLVFLALLAGSPRAGAQDSGFVPEEKPLPPPRAILEAPCEPTISGFPAPLPGLPQNTPRPAREVNAFVQGLSTNDSLFEVIVGQSRLLTLRQDLVTPRGGKPLIALGDPSVVDFNVLSPRQIRIIGLRLGSTDLSITTADNQIYNFEVQVVADLPVLRAQLKAMFPDASLKLAQMRDHLVVEGEARDVVQVDHILEAIRAFLLSVQATEARKVSGQSIPATAPTRREGVPGGGAPAGGAGGVGPGGAAGTLPGENPAPGQAQPEPETIIEHGQITASAGIVEPHIINLIRVPGSQQVLLKVRVAELDRSALRSIGADFIGQNPAAGAIFGTQIGGSSVAASAQFAGSSLTGTATGATTSSTTVFGIFDRAHFEFLLNILKTNGVMKILAEPDLVTMSGHPASFLAGGEFPVPIPQASGVGGGAVVTVAFKEFGVRLGFVPYVLDGNVIRLTVDPEVSAIDQSVAATLVQGGSPVPGITTRKTHTTVELVQGQTLAIAGLLQLSLAGNTARIPVLGDLPILGPFFSNTSSNRTEKELVVLVTPYLVEPMNKEQVPPSPGEEYKEPNNLELFLLNRIEGRTGQDYRSTIRGEEPLRIRQELKLEKDHVRGPCGFSE